MSLGEISNKTIRKKITENIVKQELGHKSYLLKDGESYILEKAEIKVAHGLLKDIKAVSDELQQVIHGVGCRYGNKAITPPSTRRYSSRAIARVNKEEENIEEQKIKTTVVIIKVSG